MSRPCGSRSSGLLPSGEARLIVLESCPQPIRNPEAQGERTIRGVNSPNNEWGLEEI
jgi:hypothetical protein